MYQKIKNGEQGVGLQETLELFEGYLVNLNQRHKTNNSMINFQYLRILCTFFR
jgi:hypothetical protein